MELLKLFLVAKLLCYLLEVVVEEMVMVMNVVLVVAYALYVVRREKIDVAAMVRSILRRG